MMTEYPKDPAPPSPRRREGSIRGHLLSRPFQSAQDMRRRGAHPLQRHRERRYPDDYGTSPDTAGPSGPSVPIFPADRSRGLFEAPSPGDPPRPPAAPEGDLSLPGWRPGLPRGPSSGPMTPSAASAPRAGGTEGPKGLCRVQLSFHFHPGRPGTVAAFRPPIHGTSAEA